MKDITVLVSACGAQFMPGLADCLKQNGERNVRIVGVDMGIDKTVLPSGISMEIIVVDNGSSGENRIRLERLAEQFHFRYFYHPMEFNFSVESRLAYISSFTNNFTSHLDSVFLS